MQPPESARSITLALGGRWHGRSGLAFCPCHANTRTPALSLKNGNDGKLLVHCFAGCDGTAVLRAIRDRGLGGDWRPDPAVAAQHKAEDAAERLRRIDQARRCWSEAGPVTGSLAQRYLRARGITCDLPPTLRFHPECWHGPTARKVPAMVSAVAIGQKLVGVHRTYLAEPGVKAFDNAKLMLGCCAGGAVRLTPPARSLVVAEGIETGLSLVQGIDRPVEVWSTLSTSGMAGLILPSDRDEIVIGPDGDEPGRKAAAMLADRGGAAGLSVRIMRCPSGRDFNDMLMEVVR